ncbi:MAG TPA: hypothetical protein VGB28_06545 [Actinomycetota bacterium]
MLSTPKALTTAVIVSVLISGGSAAAAPPYPDDLPDFAHRDDPHSERYSFTGGSTDRPMLVLYAEFNDVPYPAGQDAAFWEERFFGPFPSVRDYFIENSHGDLVFSRALETDASNGGAVNDGIVSISVDQDKGDFLQMGRSAEAKFLLEEADPFVDFSDFDRNGDGRITNLELVVHRFDADPDLVGGCGTTRGVDPVTLDGVDMEIETTNDGTDTNLATIIHETTHVALDTIDRYRAGVGRFDIMGPTCNNAPLSLRRTTAWHLLHLGWANPYIPTRDAYGDVNGLNLAGEHFILYDPDEGTDRYYIVENRIREDGTYDDSASDSGLVIWEINDDLYTSDTNAVRPIEIKRPDGTIPGGCNGGCYGGSGIDAWDPSDDDTPQRAFAPTTGPRVAVRAIPAASGSMRVFFDVRGPGILVDPMDETGHPMRIDVTPEETNILRIPVMNTGEETDTFRFELFDLPAGWTPGFDHKTLEEHEPATAFIPLRPAADAPTGVQTIGVVGRDFSDPTIASNGPFEVNVVLDETDLTYTGQPSAPTGEGAGFTAQVTNPDDAGTPPVEGATVMFELDGPGGSLSASGVSGADGVASADPSLSVPPGAYELTVSMDRFGKHAPASVTVPYMVERRPSALAWAGDTVGQYSDPTTASAILTDAINGAPLPGRTIGLAMGPQGASATTGPDGQGSAQIVLDQPADLVPATASFDGDPTYLPTEVTVAYQVRKETLSFAYTGDGAVVAPAAPVLAAHATQDADGSPGDLSLAEARFDLTPTLTSMPLSFTAGVDASGDAITVAPGLPIDLWGVEVTVPGTNLYWTGGAVGTIELAVMDGERSLAGAGMGPDTASMRTRLTLGGVQHDGTAWKNPTRLDGSFGRFEGDAYDWVVVAGDRALVQVRGMVNGAFPGTLRYTVADGGAPGVGADAFTATLRDPMGTMLYGSGDVTLSSGNLRLE